MQQLNDFARLEALYNSGLFTPSEDNGVNPFDRLTRLACKMFDMPISLVTLLDEDTQWFRSRQGIDAPCVPSEDSFCQYTIQSNRTMVIPDAQQDNRFKDNPLVTGDPNIRFYAGAPLISKEGYGLGAMCIIDTKPRELSDEEKKLLEDFGQLVMMQADLMNSVGRIDAFSGLPNRRQLHEDLTDLSKNSIGEHYIAVVAEMVGRIQLENIMHTLGSTYSDVLIEKTTEKLKNIMGDNTKIYHQDTATYAFLIKDNGTDDIYNFVKQIETEFREPLIIDGIPLHIQPALGLYHFTAEAETGPDVVRKASIASFDARESARMWSLYDIDNDNSRQRSFRLLSDLPGALKSEDQLYLVYQPKVGFEKNGLLNVEALLRWDHPELGAISPGEFIPLIEHTEFTEPVTQKVINMALPQIVAWEEAGLQTNVSINVSPRNLEEDDFTDKLYQALKKHDVSPVAIEFEFTESAFIRNSATVIDQLKNIQKMGVNIAIDDFGSGYSNYSYLQQIPANTLKLDRCMIKNLSANTKDQILVHMVISMAHQLGYDVVAEGVETREEYEMLKEWNCDKIQGYYIARPLIPVELFSWANNYYALSA